MANNMDNLNTRLAKNRKNRPSWSVPFEMNSKDTKHINLLPKEQNINLFSSITRRGVSARRGVDERRGVLCVRQSTLLLVSGSVI